MGEATNLESALMSATGSSSGRSVGVDVEPIANPAFGKDTFLDRNYTQKERDSCAGSDRSLAGLWAGKEAVVKALGNAGASLRSADSPLTELCRRFGCCGGRCPVTLFPHHNVKMTFFRFFFLSRKTPRDPWRRLILATTELARIAVGDLGSPHFHFHVHDVQPLRTEGVSIFL